MQSDEEKDFAAMKREALAQSLESQYSFENYKYSLAGAFWGLVTGVIMGYSLPQEKMANNEWLNKNKIITGAQYPTKIFRHVMFSTFTMLGTATGACIDFVRTHKRIAARHALEQSIPVGKEQEAETDTDNVANVTKMQDMVVSRKQIEPSHKTR